MAEQAQAEALKAAGNAAYKARNFEEAIQKYQQAFELHKDAVYLNNLAAVYFEQGDFDLCIQTCEKAVDEAREQRADFKIIAKALGRIGSAYAKKQDYDNAIKYRKFPLVAAWIGFKLGPVQKSLAEARTPDILAKLKEAEKAKAEAVKQAYINPELAEKARAEGNVLFKMKSVKLYEEAIKRDPSDPRGYTNRASAYLKLLALHEALKDAETAIAVDPTFVKGYIRKANVKFAMKDYSQALEACQAAREADKENKNTVEINQQERKCMEAQYAETANETDEERLARAARDPEVARILSDPVINQILQQAQADPQVLQAHLKNPDFRQKIAKLQAAGILRLGRA